MNKEIQLPLRLICMPSAHSKCFTGKVYVRYTVMAQSHCTLSSETGSKPKQGDKS